MSADADPLRVFAAALARGEPPPLEWAIEHAPDGDLNGAVARLWPTSISAASRLYLTCRAAWRGIGPPHLWQYALDAIGFHPTALDSEMRYWQDRLFEPVVDAFMPAVIRDLVAAIPPARVTP